MGGLVRVQELKTSERKKKIKWGRKSDGSRQPGGKGVGKPWGGKRDSASIRVDEESLGAIRNASTSEGSRKDGAGGRHTWEQAGLQDKAPEGRRGMRGPKKNE